MEYYKNGTLADLIQSGTLYKDKARIWKILSNLLNGLQYVHKLNIVHRDLKPSNIFFDDDGVARIGDFGLGYFAMKDASTADEPASASTAAPEITSPAGTRMYAPPEQLRSDSEAHSRTAGKDHVTTKVSAAKAREAWLPPMKTASEKTQIFSNARVGKLDAAVKGTIYEKLILHCLEYDQNKRPSVDEVMEYLMMTGGDMAVSKESLDTVLSYLRRSENYIFPTVVKSLFGRVGAG
ncbi:hypothetical protein BLSTO_05813 [Blastocystis sp. subtype 1]